MYLRVIIEGGGGGGEEDFLEAGIGSDGCTLGKVEMEAIGERQYGLYVIFFCERGEELVI